MKSWIVVTITVVVFLVWMFVCLFFPTYDDNFSENNP